MALLSQIFTCKYNSLRTVIRLHVFNVMLLFATGLVALLLGWLTHTFLTTLTKHLDIFSGLSMLQKILQRTLKMLVCLSPGQRFEGRMLIIIIDRVIKNLSNDCSTSICVQEQLSIFCGSGDSELSRDTYVRSRWSTA